MQQSREGGVKPSWFVSILAERLMVVVVVLLLFVLYDGVMDSLRRVVPERYIRRAGWAGRRAVWTDSNVWPLSRRGYVNVSSLRSSWCYTPLSL